MQHEAHYITLTGAYMPQQVRVTVSIDEEALKVYKGMAQVSGISLSRCMGEWLADTADGAQMITVKLSEARKAPQRVLNEMLAMTAGLRDTVLSVKHSTRNSEGVARPPKGAGLPLSPPLSNTGVKVPRKGRGHGKRD